MQIADIVSYIKKVIEDPEKGAQYFDPDRKGSKGPNYRFVGGYFRDKDVCLKNVKKPTMNSTCMLEDKDIHSKLFEHAIKILRKNGVGKTTIEQFTQSMTSIDSSGTNGIEGNVHCILCKCAKLNRNPITVQSKTSGNPPKVYWTMSNFSKHLEKVHKNKRKIKREKFADLSNEFDYLGDESMFGELSTTTVVSNIANETMNSDDGASSDLNQNYQQNDSVIFENDSNANQPLDINQLQSLIYNQISAQILDMSNAMIKYDETEKDMKFLIEDETYKAKYTKIAPNGSCFFGASVHQLLKHHTDSRLHAKETKKLRADVVNYIKKHRPNFEYELKGAAFDLWGGAVSEAIQSASTKFLEEELPKSHTWAGVESLKAVISMKQVNILVVNENGIAYFPKGFDMRLNRTAILAFTKLSFEVHEVSGVGGDDENGCIVAKVENISNTDRDHYNSIVRMDQADIYVLSKSLATQIYKRLTSKLPEHISIDDSINSSA